MGVGMFIVTDFINLIFAIMGLCCNGMVLRLFITKKIDSKRNFRIFLYLAIADTAYGIFVLPYVSYMIVFWRPDRVNYDPLTMAVLGMPLPVFLKITEGLSCGAAIERILALFFPIKFRHVNHVFFSNVVIIISIAISSIDLIYSMVSFRLVRVINCSSIGCYFEENFTIYWGVSNTVISTCIVILSFLVFLKVRQLQSSTMVAIGNKGTNRNVAIFNARRSRLANRATSGILITNLLCIVIPSLFLSLYEKIAKVSFFAVVGPYYLCFSLASGVMNSCIFLILNKKLKEKEVPKVVPTRNLTVDSYRMPSSMHTTIN